MSKYSNRELALIAGEIQKLESLYAFGYDRLHPKHSNSIIWADAALMNFSPFSSVVKLLQTMNDLGFKSSMQIHVSSPTQKDVMADGMMSFLQVQWPSTPVINGALPVTQEEAAFIQSFKPIRAEQRRISAQSTPVTHSILPPLNLHWKQDDKINRLYLLLAMSLVHARDSIEESKGHNIGALLVGNEGQILSWGVNTVHKNGTYHAEVNTLQRFYTIWPSMPPGCRLFTTLKPCSMCAGMFMTVKGDQCDVIYAQNDPGNHAQGTALMGTGLERQVGNDRKIMSLYQSPQYKNSGVINKARIDMQQYQAVANSKTAITKDFLNEKAGNEMFKAGLNTLLRKREKYGQLAYPYSTRDSSFKYEAYDRQANEIVYNTGGGNFALSQNQAFELYKLRWESGLFGGIPESFAEPRTAYQSPENQKFRVLRHIGAFLNAFGLKLE